MPNEFETLEPEFKERSGNIVLPNEVNEFHNRDDVDSSTLAHHHTLGTKANQAAPGNHKHFIYGNNVVTTDGAGYAFVPFTPNLQSDPKMVLAMGGNGEQVAFGWGAHALSSVEWDKTGFWIACFTPAGAVMVTVNVRILWTAFL